MIINLAIPAPNNPKKLIKVIVNKTVIKILMRVIYDPYFVKPIPAKILNMIVDKLENKLEINKRMNKKLLFKYLSP